MSTIYARDAVTTAPTIVADASLAELYAIRDRHPLWRNRLFLACLDGTLDHDDLRYVFAQYYAYSRNFTRYLSALMANLENDYHRAQLAQNLWEEGGGCEPDRRHAELYRRFLRDACGVADPETTELAPFTTLFVREYLDFCLDHDALAASAFLSLGTESIVPRMYGIFMTGLERAGFKPSELEFFQIHIACDDEHAETLEQIMRSFADEPRWFDVCCRAMLRALDLRHAFFERVFDELSRQRVTPVLERINAGASLHRSDAAVHHRPDRTAPSLYENHDDANNIDFTVTRIPLIGEVLDPRRVSIPPGRSNECHRHAHETFIHILSGTGRVLIDGQLVEVCGGDSIFVPRWALHQTTNTGHAPLEFLAVTDYRLTKRAFVGDASAYRQHEAANAHRDE